MVDGSKDVVRIFNEISLREEEGRREKRGRSEEDGRRESSGGFNTK